MTRLVWFRSDLRLADNPAFHRALLDAGKSTPRTPVLAAFIVSAKEWTSHDMSMAKADFIMRNVADLSRRLWSRHRIPLLVRVVDSGASNSISATTASSSSTSSSTVIDALRAIIAEHQVRTLYWNDEYEVDERKRDARVRTSVEKGEMAPCNGVQSFEDQCVVRPGLLRSKAAGNPYTVFTPFKKSWYEYVYTHQTECLTVYGEHTTDEATTSTFRNPDTLSKLPQPDVVPTSIPGYAITDTAYLATLHKLWPAGEDAAHKRLHAFVDGELVRRYDDDRNTVALEKGTSGLSTYLASGVISAKMCVVAAMKVNGQRMDSGQKGVVCWISELVWRDFYRHVLVAFPRVCMNKPFKLDTMTIPWRDDPAEFKAWCAGRTGYPIVDAAMRQLNATGWMHNRARMIVGSFLTKHMLHSWQDGERYFMRHQIDADFSSNNGGWQWVASTGTDAQPYFRVFNPHNQSERFDPAGTYIRRWVPELRSITDAAALHHPLERLGRAKIEKLGYVVPIVQHEVGRARAIAVFKENAGKKSKVADGDSDDGAEVEVSLAAPPAKKQRKAPAKRS